MRPVKKILAVICTLIVSYLAISYVYQSLFRDVITNSAIIIFFDSIFVASNITNEFDQNDFQFALNFLVAIATLILGTPILEKLRNRYFAIEASLIIRPYENDKYYSYMLELRNVSDHLLTFESHIFLSDYRWEAGRKIRISNRGLSCLGVDADGNAISVKKMFPDKFIRIHFSSNKIENVKLFINNHSKRYNLNVLRNSFVTNIDEYRIRLLKISKYRMIVFASYFAVFTVIFIIRIFWLLFT